MNEFGFVMLNLNLIFNNCCLSLNLPLRTK